jgi:hypothetical protein
MCRSAKVFSRDQIGKGVEILKLVSPKIENDAISGELTSPSRLHPHNHCMKVTKYHLFFECYVDRVFMNSMRKWMAV